MQLLVETIVYYYLVGLEHECLLKRRLNILDLHKKHPLRLFPGSFRQFPSNRQPTTLKIAKPGHPESSLLDTQHAISHDEFLALANSKL